MTTIVFATDSPQGRAAVAWALDERPDGSTEHLHLVLSLSDIPGRPGIATHRTVDELTSLLAHLGEHATVHPAAPHPADLAVELSEQHDARLLVIGVPHRGPTMKILLGSHVQHLISAAPCPVVCVKADRP